jgi:rhodanese-related sulfurtransferase
MHAHQFAAFELAQPTHAGYRDVTPDVARDARGKVRMIDVREEDELHDDGFIPGIEHVPLAALVATASTWRKHDDLIIVCRSGGRSARGATELVRLGFTRVMNLAGGMLAYTRAGFPIARL